MFLDEELEAIHNEGLDIDDKAQKIKAAWMERIPHAACSDVDFANALKRIDSAWRMFCDRHGEYKKEAFREFIRPKSQFADRTTEILNRINDNYLKWW